jgi:hypothetical protein
MPRARRTCVEVIRNPDGDRLCPLLATHGNRCEAHARAAEARRGTRQQRGYDARHDAIRRRLLPRAYNKPCPLCGEVMRRGDDLHLDHSIPLWIDRTSIPDRIVHASCNLKRPKHPTRP